jgi:hemimethylated DNA binding protein
MQSEAWMLQNGVDKLKHGRHQPFYHVLPDARDRSGVPVNYVAHEHVMLDTPHEPIRHQLIDDFFEGFDAHNGRFVPTSQLRSRYAVVEERVIPPEEGQGDEGGEADEERVLDD